MQADTSPAPVTDRLSPLLQHFHVRTHMFHSGPLCGTTAFYDGPDLGYLHVLRAGTVQVAHYGDSSPLGSALLTEPTLLFYPSAAPHRFITPTDRSTHMVCATVRFDAGPAHPVAAVLPPLCLVPLASVPGLARTVDALFAEAMPEDASAPACGRQLICDRLFDALLVQLLRWLIDHPPAGTLGYAPTLSTSQNLLAGLAHPQLARALNAMHGEPGKLWDLPRLAEVAGMSRSSFAATFHRVVGTPPADYLARWRMVLAGQWLARGEPLKQVALQLGYSNASAFSRAFAAHHGQAPRAWREQQDVV